MKNSEAPYEYQDSPINPWECPTNDGGLFNYKGLTKREYFAGLAMQGIISRVLIIEHNDYVHISKQSIMAADELLKQLETK